MRKKLIKVVLSCTLVISLLLSMGITAFAYKVNSAIDSTLGGFESESIFNTANSGWVRSNATDVTINDITIDGVPGAYRGDNYAKIVSPANAGQLTITTGTLNSTNRSFAPYQGAIKMSLRVEDFEINKKSTLKINNIFLSNCNFFDITTDKRMTVLGNEVIPAGKMQAGRWYSICVIFNTMSTSNSSDESINPATNRFRYTVYLDGETTPELTNIRMTSSQLSCIDNTTTSPFFYRFERFDTLSINICTHTSDTLTSTMYVDDVYLLKNYNATNFANATTNVSVAVDESSLPETLKLYKNSMKIGLWEETAYSDFVELITGAIPSNSTLKIYQSDEKTLVTDGTMAAGMLAVITGCDGATMAKYQIVEASLPTIAAATLSGVEEVGSVIKGSYSGYYDANGVEDIGTTWALYRSSTSSFASKTLVSSGTFETGVTNVDYEIASENNGYYLRFEVAPAGGATVLSNVLGPITGFTCISAGTPTYNGIWTDDSTMTGVSGAMATTATGASAIFTPAISTLGAGYYRILLKTVAGNNDYTSIAQVTVSNDGATTSRYIKFINNTAYAVTDLDIGKYYFNGDGTETITVTNVGGTARIVSAELRKNSASDMSLARVTSNVGIMTQTESKKFVLYVPKGTTSATIALYPTYSGAVGAITEGDVNGNINIDLSTANTFHITVDLSGAVETYLLTVQENMDFVGSAYYKDNAMIEALEAGNVENRLTLRNYKTQAVTVLYATALYEKTTNKLVSINFQNNTQVPGANESVLYSTVTVPAEYTNYYVKTFLWDSAGTMQPYEYLIGNKFE